MAVCVGVGLRKVTPFVKWRLKPKSFLCKHFALLWATEISLMLLPQSPTIARQIPQNPYQNRNKNVCALAVWVVCSGCGSQLEFGLDLGPIRARVPVYSSCVRCVLVYL